LSLLKVRNATPVDGLELGGVSWAPLSCAMNVVSKVSAAAGLTQSATARIDEARTVDDTITRTS
jgi:hypothetical protein